jgi:dienelactone hydrolase
MSITTGKSPLEARLGRALRGLARRWPGGDARPTRTDWTQTLLRFVHRYEPSEGRGPFPTAILLHGCGGDFDHLESWGRFLAGRGILAFTIDSLSPRGLGPLSARCLVCTGLALRGEERCRDITTVLPSVLADPHVDRDRISLVGWSHGAWTSTEWMLDAKAEAVAGAAPLFVDSVVLVYPYCGILSGIHERPWTSRSRVLVVTGDADRIVPNAETRAFVEALSRASVPVTHVALDGVGHAFDVESNGAFDATKAAELREIVASFLRPGGL